MRATAVQYISEFVPVDLGEPAYTIGAHADHRREDFIFPRMQSRSMRDAPWASRGKPIRSWSELAGIGLLYGVAGVALLVSAALI